MRIFAGISDIAYNKPHCGIHIVERVLTVRVVLFSNTLNHYMQAVSDAFFEQLGDQYAFVENAALDAERRALGWKSAEAPYLKRSSDMTRQELAQLLMESDLVIFGAVPFSLVKPRLKMERLSFFYTERVLKKGDGPLVFLPRWLKYRNVFGSVKHCSLLATGSRCASDFERMGLFSGKRFVWGYFPAVRRLEDRDGLFDDKEPASIVWAGRFIDWKHPELLLHTAKRLREKGLTFRVTMVGGGPLFGEMQELAGKLGLRETVSFTGPVSPEAVRGYMEGSEIFVHTAGRDEGWGVVLQEAMNALCAPVVKRDMGAAECLIEDNVNGRFYRDEQELAVILEELLTNREKTRTMALKGLDGLEELWNPETAVSRFLETARAMEQGKALPVYGDGPMKRL